MCTHCIVIVIVKSKLPYSYIVIDLTIIIYFGVILAM